MSLPSSTLASVHEIVARVDEPVGIYAPDDNQDEVADEDRSRIQNPYFAWDFPVAQRDLTKTRRYFRRKQGEELFDVVILGGSVAGGFARDAGGYLGELLSADPRLEGRAVAVLHDHEVGAVRREPPVHPPHVGVLE